MTFFHTHQAAQNLQDVQDAVTALTGQLRQQRMSALAYAILETLSDSPSHQILTVSIQVEKYPSLSGMGVQRVCKTSVQLLKHPDATPEPVQGLPESIVASSVTGAGYYEADRAEPLLASLLNEFKTDAALAAFKLSRILDVEFEDVMDSHCTSINED